jgi:hypothetical protein
MAKKKSGSKNLLKGIILMLLGITIWIVSNMVYGVCKVPSGWDIINPLSWVGYTGCMGNAWMFSVSLGLVGGILLFAGVFTAIRKD